MVDIGENKTNAVSHIPFQDIYVHRGANGASGSFAWDDDGFFGEYGTITKNANGTFTYTPNAAKRAEPAKGGVATETFGFTYTDGDGDVLHGQVVINIAGTGTDSSGSKVDLSRDGDEALVTISFAEVPATDAEITYTVNGETFTQTILAGQASITHRIDVPESPYLGQFNIKAEITGIEGGWDHALSGSWAQDDFDYVSVPAGVHFEMDKGKANISIDFVPKDAGEMTIRLDDGSEFRINLAADQGEYGLDIPAEHLGSPYGEINTAIISISGGGYTPQEDTPAFFPSPESPENTPDSVLDSFSESSESADDNALEDESLPNQANEDDEIVIDQMIDFDSCREEEKAVETAGHQDSGAIFPDTTEDGDLVIDWMMDFESGKQEADNAPADDEPENDPVDIDSLIDEGLVNLPATGEEPECPHMSSIPEEISAPEPDLPYAPVDTGNEDAIVMATAEVENQ